VRGLLDLHCHFVAGIDDGARTSDEGVAMLRALRDAGFDRVIATPHMRPGLFDNEQADLVAAFERMRPALEAETSLPHVELSSEHYFDDVVYDRLLSGAALPYPGGHAVLLEFYGEAFPRGGEERLFELGRRGLLPVIAHPERYRYLWRSSTLLERLIDGGAAALLDVAALTGKYGGEPQRCARDLLERGLYQAACTDSHRVADVADARAGIAWLEKQYGLEEVEALFRTGPQAILAGEPSA
jgi:protein-tyrosine phosphatase